MFVTDHLVFMELQKTGGSHIRRLLKQYTDGDTEGKHNRLNARPEDKMVFGSIRNPWDWYVSLWAYGVGGKGAIRARVETGVDFNYYYRMLPKAMGKNWLTPGEFFVSLKHDVMKPTEQWQRTYQNAEDPKLFQAWIKLLLAEDNRYDIGEGYGFSPISKHSGLFSYRYFRLFTLGEGVFHDARLSRPEDLAEYDAEQNIAEGMIRMESLEEDFVQVLKKAGEQLSDEQVASILNKEGGKTNMSKRNSVAYYYDDETMALVAQRDGYLINKYGYEPPA